MLSISTSWNHQPSLNMNQWLDQIKTFGLSAIELGYTLTAEQLGDIKQAVGSLGLRVSSIHNFCPVPDDEPSPRHPSNYYRLTSVDEHERQKAVEWTKKTIDLTREVNAPVVIIHAGTIEIQDDPSPELFDLYKSGMQNTKEYETVRQQLLEKRAEAQGPFLQLLEKSLDEVMGHAVTQNIKIGLETRYYPNEIPNFKEIGYLLDLFRGQGLGYWHDVGHAEVQERLKLHSHDGFLKSYQKDLLGVHIHGINELRDHLAPFDGDMETEKFLPLIGKDVIKVIEARYATEDQIKKSVDNLNALL